MSEGRPGGLLAWQYTHYPEFHGDRRNLVLHFATVPLFQSGTLLVTSPVWGPWWLALVGLGLMVTAVAAQGRGHALEKKPPVPFASRGEAVARIVLEQWINFPRFVLSGSAVRAWRGS
jgi:hypothetical protein